MRNTQISHDELLRLFSYNEKTGVFTNRETGKPLWKSYKNYYRRITINGVSYAEHRLAWFYVFGKWPGELDHIDRVKYHNSIDNLREATGSQNMANMGLRLDNRTGIKGVDLHRGKFRAQIRRGGRKITLGSYPTPEEASRIYQAACIDLHGEFAAFS
jgi:hypothetical protein